MINRLKTKSCATHKFYIHNFFHHDFISSLDFVVYILVYITYFEKFVLDIVKYKNKMLKRFILYRIYIYLVIRCIFIGDFDPFHEFFKTFIETR